MDIATDPCAVKMALVSSPQSCPDVRVFLLPKVHGANCRLARHVGAEVFGRTIALNRLVIKEKNLKDVTSFLHALSINR